MVIIVIANDNAGLIGHMVSLNRCDACQPLYERHMLEGVKLECTVELQFFCLKVKCIKVQRKHI